MYRIILERNLKGFLTSKIFQFYILRWELYENLKYWEKFVDFLFFGSFGPLGLPEHSLKISERLLSYSSCNEHFYLAGCLKISLSNAKKPVAKVLFPKYWSKHSNMTHQIKACFTPVPSAKVKSPVFSTGMT